MNQSVNFNQRNIDEFAAELNAPFNAGGPYSTDRFGKNWKPCIKMLRKRGCNDEQIETIIRSKWTRWAGDMSSNPYGKVNSADLARFMDSMPSWVGALADLMSER